MKKLLFVTLEYPPTRGGVAEYLRGLVDALPKGSATVLALPMPRLPLAWLLLWPRVWAEVRRLKPDMLVVSHLLPVGHFARILKRRIGLPYIVIVHGTDLKRAARPRKRALAQAILHEAAVVMANSEFTRGLALGLGADPARTAVVHPCPSEAADPSAPVSEDVRKRYGLAGKRVMLSVGRLVPRKGFDLLIDALPAVRKRCGDAVLLIVGAGPERSALESRAARLEIGESVIFAGAVASGALPDFYRAADLFTLAGREMPDDVEGFGIAYLEAAAFGLPAVAVRVGGAAEAVQEDVTGLVVEPKDVEGLPEAICRLLEDRTLATRMGENGRARVAQAFTWKAQAEKFMRLADAI